MEKTKLFKKKIPGNPGVYFFLSRKKEILYIGKATSLKHRIKSYFDIDITDKRSFLIGKMIQEAHTVQWTETDSVLEAMLLETNLIRTHKPTYNTRSKDDKSYNHVVITKENFPRIFVVRGKDLSQDTENDYLSIYGPFPSGNLFKEALKIIRKLFQFYDTKTPIDDKKSKVQRGKIDFNRQIGLYPEICSQKEYAKNINQIQLFFEGKKKKLITNLEKEMFDCAHREAFEQAHILKKKIFALQHIQDVSLIKDESKVYKDANQFCIEAYDIAHMNGQDVVGVMTTIIGGVTDKRAYRKFHIKSFKGSDDTRALAEVLDRRLKHEEWIFPDLIVVDGGIAQKNAALRILEKHKRHITVVCVVKDIRHRPERIIGPIKIISEFKQAILLANSEAHRFAITFHTKKRNKSFIQNN